MTAVVVQEEIVAEPIHITDLGMFAQHLVEWHTHQVATLQHIAQLPEGTEVVVGDDGQTLLMTGEVRRAFQLGINLSLGYMGTLPFVPEFEEEDVATGG